MAPSKGWMDLVGDHLNDIYLRGVEKFLDYAFKKNGMYGEIHCPCVKCSNRYSVTREVVRTHLKVYGIIRSYTFWYHHGERVGEYESDSESDQLNEDEPSDEMHDMLRDLYPEFCDQDTNYEDMDTFSHDIHEEDPNDEADKFYRLLKDFEQPLYKGPKSSKLSCLVKLLHIKSLGRWSNKSFTMLLQLLKDELLPGRSTLPDSYYDAKKDTCKQCYMGHRRYLPLSHKWRNDKESFDGTRERGLPPKPLAGDDILDQVKDLEGVILTKAPHIKKVISHDGRGDNWNKKSIFFDLPY
ncbi:hypothetical protein GH714_027496 [Hevea brasiliensis]|uniref:Transposase-associated domain-containing protein n=1 Tax=Hevea brasiliensis TaxID=3981 RepID=A0A6A6NJI7_HEVBR|nr:hypothetical protein GH714_027496 [Hevea brasiliensis]